MKNYRLFKLQVMKTGFIFGVNKFGHKWLEIRVVGKLVRMVSLSESHAFYMQKMSMNAFLCRTMHELQLKEGAVYK